MLKDKNLTNSAHIEINERDNSKPYLYFMQNVLLDSFYLKNNLD